MLLRALPPSPEREEGLTLLNALVADGTEGAHNMIAVQDILDSIRSSLKKARGTAQN
jgi:hypothetical protein